MKKLLLVLLCLPIIGFGQKTYVPDDNFEQKLINLGFDNFLDDSVITASIDTVTSLFVTYDSISDLTGIENFSSLTFLDCIGNQLSILDLSNNTALTTLWCFNNQLNILDVSNNTALTTLRCHDNQLNILDVSNNTALTNLECHHNQLTTLNVSGATALTTLWCFNNQLTTLDVSNNTALTKLYCSFNLITNLDVTNNISLENFNCNGNLLTSLDVSNNTALSTLMCDSNNLISMDLRNGNNLNFQFIYSKNNPFLNCITVDDSAWSTNNWTGQLYEFDPQHYFSNNCSGTTSLIEKTTNRELLKLIDLLGQKTKGNKNQPLFYIYDDGKVEKKIIID